MKGVNQAVVLAGGVGSRLASEIGQRPKLLIEIGGISLAERQLNEFLSTGIKTVTYLLGVGSDEAIAELLVLKKKFAGRFKIEWHIEGERLGTGGSLLNSLDSIQDSFMIMYGDLYLNCNLLDLEKRFLNSNADFACVVHPSSHMFDSNIVEVDTEDQIVGFHKKDRKSEFLVRNLGNTGVYFFKRHIFLDYKVQKCDLDGDLIPQFLNESRKGIAMRHHGFIRDIGTPSRLQESSRFSHPTDFHELNRPTLFLDRDGVVNKHLGHITNPSQIVLREGISSLISRFNRAWYWVIVITNQPVVSHGEISMSRLDQIHAMIDIQLSKQEAYIDEYFVCPHHPDKGFSGEVRELKTDCNCRKPSLGLLELAKAKYKIDLDRSVMVGDTWRDEEFAKRAGISFVSLSEFQDEGAPVKEVLDAIIPISDWWLF
jgi:mannose-1-phosphate guanylyltransferase/phosphomannomutase